MTNLILHATEIRARRDGAGQVRRVVKPQPVQIDGPVIEWCHPRSGCIAAQTTTELLWHCPWGEAGDELWVRETWASDDNKTAWYRADGETYNAGLPWRSPVTMPRWASRLTLELVGVRVERLQCITEADAIASGIDWAACHHSYAQTIGAYAAQWDTMNAAHPWRDDPWVWVLDVRRVK